MTPLRPQALDRRETNSMVTANVIVEKEMMKLALEGDTWNSFANVPIKGCGLYRIAKVTRLPNSMLTSTRK